MQARTGQFPWQMLWVAASVVGCGATAMQGSPNDESPRDAGGGDIQGTASVATGGVGGAGSTGGWATTPPSCQVVEFKVPTSEARPHAITRGPDGNIWFTEWAANQIGRVTPSGTIKEFRIPVAQSGAEDITAGPDGNVWFSEWGFGLNMDNNIGRVTPAGVITEFPVDRGGQVWPFGITAGPDGNLWFTQFAAAGIAHMSPSGKDYIEFSFPKDELHEAYDITTGPDGNLWFTDFGNNTIGRITLKGQITTFPVSMGPGGIVTGPDGNLWFVENTGSEPREVAIGRITPEGVVSEFRMLEPDGNLWDITTGPDGNLWFTDNGRNEIGRISPDGTVARCPIPTADSMPERIALGADGNLWFTEAQGNNIGRITP